MSAASLPDFKQLAGEPNNDDYRTDYSCGESADPIRHELNWQPIINLLRDHLLDADLVHADETVIQVLKEPGRTRTGKEAASTA